MPASVPGDLVPTGSGDQGARRPPPSDTGRAGRERRSRPPSCATTGGQMAHGPRVARAATVVVDEPLASRPLGARLGTYGVYALAVVAIALTALEGWR